LTVAATAGFIMLTILMFLMAQRYIVAGLTAGAVKA
jgi:ABC-type maltose transport system permease subunit